MTFSERYTIEVPLGENEVGAVWRGRATEGGTRVAIVMLEDDAPEEVRARFEDHAKKLVTVRHPNVARAMEHGVTEEGAPFLVIELVEGVSLAKRLATEPPLSVGRAVELASHLAEGLLAAHAAGLTHGDIEPGNVLLVETEGTLVPKLVGFALNRADRRAQRDAAARLSLPSLATQWAYAAPEQVRGETVASAPADLYSLAAVLFAMLSGHPPHVAPDVTSLLEAIAHGKAPALGSLKKELASFSTILERALSSTADKRPADVTAFLRGLKTATAFAKTAHPLPVPVGVRSPIGTPPAPAAKATAAMPRPVARPGAPPSAGSKVVVQKPGATPATKATGAGAPTATKGEATPSPADEEPRESIELLSIPPPARPPPPPKASAVGADLGDIAVDTEDADAVEPSAAADAHAKDEAHAEAGEAHAEAGEANSKPDEDEANAKPHEDEANAEPGEHEANAKPHEDEANAKPGEHEGNAEAGEDEANTQPGEDEAQPEEARPQEPAKAVEAAPAKVRPPAPQAARAAEPERAPVATDVPQPAKTGPLPASETLPASESKPAVASKAVPRRAEPERSPEVRAASATIDALPADDGDRPAGARPAWVLPAAGIGALALAAIAFFVFGGGGSTESPPRPVAEPTTAHASTEPDPSASETADPSVGEAASADLGERAMPEPPAEPEPTAEPGAAADPAVTAVPSPEPATEPEPPPATAARAAPPPTTPRTTTTSPGGTTAATGDRRGTAARAPRTRAAPTTTAPRERPTVVADPGF